MGLCFLFSWVHRWVFKAPAVFLLPFYIIFTLSTVHASEGAYSSTKQSLAQNSILWEELEKGLNYSTIKLKNTQDADLAVLRIDPQRFTFELYSISEAIEHQQAESTQDVSNTSLQSPPAMAHEKPAPYPQTLEQWAKKHNLLATINASMYLPDGKTSTGHMRKGAHINNKHIAKGFGAFFLANPLPEYKGNIPEARLVGRETQDLDTLLKQYSTVVQNFRMMDAQGKILWTKEGRKHSIAAIGQNTQGEILFLHCQKALTAHDFVAAILELPLNVQSLMYVEGGVQAGLALQHAKKTAFFGGEHASQFFTGSMAVALPNIIGIRPKQKRSSP